MTNDEHVQNDDAEGIDWISALSAVWKGRRIIVLAVILFLAMEVHQLHSTAYTYTAHMLVTAPPSSEGNDAPRTLGLGAFSPLLGLSGNQNASQFRLFVDSLSSHDIAIELSKNLTLMHQLFIGSWDPISKTWRHPSGLVYETNKQLKSLLGFAPGPPPHDPDANDVQALLSSGLVVTETPNKPYLVGISFSSSDRAFAIYFLGLVVKTADDLLRKKMLIRTDQYMDYLSRKLDTVTVTEHRLSLAQSLSEQEKLAMVANSDAPFAAEVFEKPWAPATPDSPKPPIRLLEAAVFGLIVGAALAYLVNAFRGPMVRWATSRGKMGGIILYLMAE